MYVYLSYGVILVAVYVFSLNDVITISNELHNCFRVQKNIHENFDCLPLLPHSLTNMTCVSLFIFIYL